MDENIERNIMPQGRKTRTELKSCERQTQVQMGPSAYFWMLLEC
jgi:hypothetical protein